MGMVRHALLAFGVLAIAGCSDQLPGGYTIRVADRGKTWLQDPDNFMVLSNVTAVGHDDRRVFTETRDLRETPPYGYAECQYHVTDTATGKTVRVATQDSGAVQRLREQIRRTRIDRSSRSCL